MNDTNERLYENALKAINRLFCDMSVSPDETEKKLNALIDEIEILRESLAWQLNN